MTQDNSTAQLVERLRFHVAHPVYTHSADEDAAMREAADLIEALTRVQPSTSSVEAVARALARSHGLGDHMGDEHLKPWLRDARTAIEAIAALPSPEREPMREGLQ